MIALLFLTSAVSLGNIDTGHYNIVDVFLFSLSKMDSFKNTCSY